MSGPGDKLSKALTAHAAAGACLGFAHSLRTRGLRRSLLLAASGITIPILGELLAVNGLGLLRHRLRPRAAGVPLAVALGWYNVGYGTLTVAEGLLSGLPESRRRRALAPATALLATDLDLLLDPCGLDLGLWEWSGEGAYAREVRGPNGARGVPLLNFAGWLAITSGVASAYLLLAAGDHGRRPRGGAAALLLLTYYLPAAAWAVRWRSPEYLLYSAPFALALYALLEGSQRA